MIVADAPPAVDEKLNPVTIKIVAIGGRARTLAGPVPSRQVAAVAASGSSLAWMLTSSTSMYEADWQVYGIAGGAAVTSIGDSRVLTPGGTPVPPEYKPLSTDGETVYWTAPTVVGTRPQASIFAAALNGSQAAHELVKGAKLPVGLAGDLWYVRGEDVAPSFAGATGEIHRLRADGRDEVMETVESSAGDRIGAMCASPGRLAWTVARAGADELYVRDLQSSESKHLPLNSAAGATYLACGHSSVVWGGGTGGGDAGQYLWRDLDASVVRLGEAPGRAVVYANGDYIAWLKPAAKGPLSALTIAQVL